MEFDLIGVACSPGSVIAHLALGSGLLHATLALALLIALVACFERAFVIEAIDGGDGRIADR